MMSLESNSEKPVSYQKKDGYDNDYKILLYCFHKLYSVVCAIPKEGAPARQSFFGYDNDKDLKVCFLMAHVIYVFQYRI